MREICFENCLSLSRFDQRWCVDILHLKWKSNISLRVFSNFQDNSFDAYTFIKCVKKVVSICIARSSTVLKTFTHPNDSFFVFSVLFHLKTLSNNSCILVPLEQRQRLCTLPLRWRFGPLMSSRETAVSLREIMACFYLRGRSSVALGGATSKVNPKRI